MRCQIGWSRKASLKKQHSSEQGPGQAAGGQAKIWGRGNGKLPLQWESAWLPEKQTGECGGSVVRARASGRRR